MRTWFAIIPPLVAVLGAAVAKRILPSLLGGVVIGALLKTGSVIGALFLYFMGSSWGTWALVMPVGFQLAATTGASLPLTIGAVLAGGSIGDNISPLGETPVLTAAIAGLSVPEHVRYVMPFGIFAAFLVAILYLVLGFVMR